MGVSASGPLVRDKLWFIAAYNPRFIRSDIVLEGFGVQGAATTRPAFAGKLDWAPSSRSQVTLSLFGDPTQIDEVNPPSAAVVLESIDPALGVRDEGSLNVSAQATTQLGARWTLDATAGYHDREESRGAQTEIGRTETLLIDLTHPDGARVRGPHARRRAEGEIRWGG